MKLPEEFKTKWIAALRSGEYKQGKKALIVKNGDEVSYCCLGVAFKIIKGIDPVDTFSGYIQKGEIDTNGIPECLIGTGGSWTGAGHDIRLKLSSMNDDGKSFSEIAYWIEENL